MNYIETVLKEMRTELDEKKLYNSLHTIEFFEEDKSVKWLLGTIAKHIIAGQLDSKVVSDAEDYLKALKQERFYRPIVLCEQ